MKRSTVRIGLQLQLILAMSMVCILALAGVLGYTAVQSRSLVDAKAAQDLSQSSDQVNVYVSAWYEKVLTHIRSASRLPQFTEGNLPVAEATLRALVKDLPDVDSARILGTDGMTLVQSIDGTLNNYSDRPWFKDAMQGSDPAMQTLISKTTGKPTMALAVPLRDGQNRIVGVVQYSVGLEKMSAMAKKAAGTKLVPILTDATGKALVGRQGDEPMADLQELAPVAAGMKAEQGSLTYAEPDSQRWLANHRRLGSTGWNLVIQLPETEVMIEGQNYMNQVLQWGLLGSAGAILLVIIAAVLVARHIARPVQQLSAAAERIAGGDLAVQSFPPRGDELGDLILSFNRMVTGIRGLVQGMTSSAQTVAETARNLTATTGQMADASRGVTVTVEQVASSATHQSGAVSDVIHTVEGLHEATRQIAQGAGEQSESAEQTVMLVDEMVHAVEEARRAAEQIMDSAGQAAASAQAGSQVVGTTITGMERIRETVQASGEQVHALNQLSAEIGQITTAITEIAEQTNLLALNAAIEAARAGGQGRGFAVVAEEVRKLAERSARSTKEIAALIQSIQSGTRAAIDSMGRIQTEVDRGTDLAREAGNALQAIMTASQESLQAIEANLAASDRTRQTSTKVMDAVSAISAVSEENTATTEQMATDTGRVSERMQSMAAIAEENAAAAEEVTASMEEMTASAETLAGAAADLLRLAGELQAQASRFKL